MDEAKEGTPSDEVEVTKKDVARIKRRFRDRGKKLLREEQAQHEQQEQANA